MRFRLALIFLVLLPAGCKNLPGLDFLSSSEPVTTTASGEYREGESAATFQVGDRFTFDNPLVRWQVVSVSDDRVHWRSDAGDEQVTRFNILLPALEWRSRTAGTGRRFIRDEVGSLFPMKVGATLSFRSTVTTSKPPFGWEHNWVCSVTGQEDVDVLDNVFETFVVACGRERPEEIVYYYAPKIGHYVVQRIAGEDGNPDRTRNLLSFERGDGTTIADVVKLPPEPAADVSPDSVAPEPVSPGAGTPPAVAGPAPERVAAPVNATPVKDGAPPSIRAAVESVTLRAPEFGGNTAPPALPPGPAAAAAVTPVVPAAMPPAGRNPADVMNSGEARGAPVPPTAPKKPGAERLRKMDPAGPRAVPVPVPVPVPSVSAPQPVSETAPRVPPPDIPSPPSLVAKAPPRAQSVSVPPPPPPPVPVAKPASEMPVAMSLQIPTPVAAPVRAPSAVPTPVAAPAAAPLAKPPAETIAPPVPTVPADPEMKQASASVETPPQGIHLASYRDLANARRGWDQLYLRNGDLLEGLRADIRRIDIGSRGTYYRLYAGPVDTADAAQLCEKLRTRGVFCTPQG